jgi:hypothetical protein
MEYNPETTVVDQHCSMAEIPKGQDRPLSIDPRFLSSRALHPACDLCTLDEQELMNLRVMNS